MRSWEEERRALEIFFGAVLPSPPTALVTAVRGYGEVPWRLAAAAALRVHQEPLLDEFVRRHAADAPLAAELAQELHGQSLLHAFRWEELRECLDHVVRALARRGIRPVLLKGASFAGEIYVPERLRPMRDLDILVREEELRAADEALAAEEFRVSEQAELYTGHHHLPPRFHPRSGICVEVHRRALSEDAVLPGVPPPAAFWEGIRDSRAPARDSGGPTPAVLEPTLSLLVTSLHFTHGEHIGWRIGQLVDVARLLAIRGDEIDWDRLRGWAREPALAASLGATVGYLAQRGFPGIPPGEVAALRRSARLRRWEERLLHALLERYRVGTPPPWRRVSMRVANILWSETLRRRSFARRVASTLNRVLSRGKKSWRTRQSRRAAAIAAAR